VRRSVARRLLGTAGLVLLVAGFGAQLTIAQTKAPAAKPAAAKLPPAIEAAFRKAYPNATIKHVSKETENGKTLWEVESIDGGRARDLNYNADGTVAYYEEALTENEIPTAVTAAIKTRYPKATITRRERLYKDGAANYEFGLKGAGVSEAILTPDGTWVSPKPPVHK